MRAKFIEAIRRAGVVVLAALAVSGCIYSDAPLLAENEYVQPIRPGRWEQLLEATEKSLARMTPEEKREHPCRKEGDKILCAFVTTISRLPDGKYELRYGSDMPPETVSVAPLADNQFIIEQVGDKGKAEYALLTVAAPNRLEVRKPRCNRDTYLHAYAKPDANDPNQCRVATRADLTSLFMAFAAGSKSIDPETYTLTP